MFWVIVGKYALARFYYLNVASLDTYPFRVSNIRLTMLCVYFRLLVRRSMHRSTRPILVVVLDG